MELFNSPDFHHHVETLMQQNRVPGLSIATVQGDDVKSIAFGLSSVQNQTPCTADTLFDIASSSKSLTAVAIALLVDDENFPQLQYDAIMSELLPDDFVLSDDSHTKIVTIDDLLGHRTGMPG
jgi:CubicO group peptidase (beta-lactamase class C family)